MTDHSAEAFGVDMLVLSREPLPGGFSDATKTRLRAVLNEDGRRVERTLLLKQTSSVEVAALTAASQVPAADAVPELIDAGQNSNGPYIVTPFYEATPARHEKTLQANAIETLARLRAHYLNRPVAQAIPVVDPDWWRTKCDVSMQRLGALERPIARLLQAQVKAFRDEPKMISALEQMPRTLIHGDIHRNNVLVDNDGQGHIIDWGGAFIGAPALDLPNLGGPDSPGYRTYIAAWQEITGQALDDDLGWHQSFLAATVWVNIKYLAFATKIFGDQKGQSMMTRATDTLNQL
ncbi:phosphotransferase [Microlunatus endophyticus]